VRVADDKHRGKDNARECRLPDRHSLVFPGEANHPPQRLNALAGNRRIYLNRDASAALLQGSSEANG
jgi:hypothetical protein